LSRTEVQVEGREGSPKETHCHQYVSLLASLRAPECPTVPDGTFEPSYMGVRHLKASYDLVTVKLISITVTTTTEAI